MLFRCTAQLLAAYKISCRILLGFILRLFLFWELRSVTDLQNKQPFPHMVFIWKVFKSDKVLKVFNHEKGCCNVVAFMFLFVLYHCLCFQKRRAYHWTPGEWCNPHVYSHAPVWLSSLCPSTSGAPPPSPHVHTGIVAKATGVHGMEKSKVGIGLEDVPQPPAP